MRDGRDVDALLHQDREERVAHQSSGGGDGHRTDALDLTDAVGRGRVAGLGGEALGVDVDEHMGPGGRVVGAGGLRDPNEGVEAVGLR
jgi:hypothetical protein